MCSGAEDASNVFCDIVADSIPRLVACLRGRVGQQPSSLALKLVMIVTILASNGTSCWHRPLYLTDHIASCCAGHDAVLVAAGAIPLLVAMIQSTDRDEHKAVFALSVLAVTNGVRDVAMSIAAAVRACPHIGAQLRYLVAPLLLSIVLAALPTDGAGAHARLMFDAGALPHLVELLSAAAARARVQTWTSRQTRVVLLLLAEIVFNSGKSTPPHACTNACTRANAPVAWQGSMTLLPPPSRCPHCARF